MQDWWNNRRPFESNEAYELFLKKFYASVEKKSRVRGVREGMPSFHYAYS
jgi:hypothetical protein